MAVFIIGLQCIACILLAATMAKPRKVMGLSALSLTPFIYWLGHGVALICSLYALYLSWQAWAYAGVLLWCAIGVIIGLMATCALTLFDWFKKG